MPQGEKPPLKIKPTYVVTGPTPLGQREVPEPKEDDRPNRLKGEEVLSPDSWRGDWYKMGFGEVWIDTGQIDVHIEVADGTVHVNLYPNKPDREALAGAGVIRFNGVWEDDASWIDFGEERKDDG